MRPAVEDRSGLSGAIVQAQQRAAQRLTMDSTTAGSLTAIDEALADLLHYRGQAASAAEALRMSGVYSPSSSRSWFRDIANKGIDPDARPALDMHRRQESDLARLENRAVNAAGFGGLIVPSYLTDLLSPALRTASPLTDLIGTPLPDLDTDSVDGNGGLVVIIPKVTTAITSTVVAENTGLSQTDPATSSVQIPVVMVSAQLQVSLQSAERANLDLMIARELIGAINATTEQLVINGTGAGVQPTGLLVQAGTTGITYTNASPTGISALPKLGACLSSSATLFQRGPADVIVSHPRFWAWLGSVGEVVEPPAPWEILTLGADVVGSCGVPVNLGAGTNETRLLTFPRAAIYCGVTDVLVETNPQVSTLAGQLTVTFTARRYLAISAIWPQAVSILQGTGMLAVAT